MRTKNLSESFSCAIQGIIFAFKTQRNMKIHFITGLLVFILSILLNISRLELLILLLTIGSVISAEMVNTAIEEVVNLVTQEYHPIARVAKNVAAGAVLVTSMISVFVGYLIFSERILNFRPEVVRHSLMNSHLIIFSLVVVISLVIMTKAFGGHTRFLQGGMPSGHAAVGFSIATAIFLVGEGFVVVLGYVLAILLAQSRVEGKIHTLWEVIVGAILGTLVTLLFFQLKG